MALTNRTIAEGSNLWAFIKDADGTYRPFAAQTGASISDDSDQLESTAKNNGAYANYQYGRNRWSATVDMMVTDDTNAAEVDVAELRLMKRAKVKPTVFFAYVTSAGVIDTTKPAYQGVVLLKTPLDAPDGELQKTTIQMQGCLELEDLEYVGSAWTKIAATYPTT